MLALPNGQVLFNDGSNQMRGLHGRRDAEPVVGAFDHVPEFHDAGPGGTYTLSGKQLAGLDQGAAYGDDVQDNTNFPLVGSPTPLPAW